MAADAGTAMEATRKVAERLAAQVGPYTIDELLDGGQVLPYRRGSVEP